MNKISTTICLLLFAAAAFFSGCADSKKNDQQAKENENIRKTFNDWTSAVVQGGRYCPPQACNPDYFTTHPRNEKSGEGLGLPDSSKFHFLFSDINSDKKMDALVTFHPVCCTCSDTTGKVIPQVQVVIVSNERGYSATDAFFNNLFADSLNINIDVDSVTTNMFYGTYFKIGKQDTSVDQYQKSISIAYDTKEMKFIQRKKSRIIEIK
jgi:hypothetical protein